MKEKGIALQFNWEGLGNFLVEHKIMVQIIYN